MVAKLVIFNGINEQCHNIFIFLYKITPKKAKNSRMMLLF